MMEAREALAFLDRPGRVDARGDYVIDLAEVIQAEGIRRDAHRHLRAMADEVDRLRARVAELEARPSYEDGIAEAFEHITPPVPESITAAILALLEPKS